jgi:urease accessory protein
MLTSTRILPALLVKPEKVIDTLTLPHDERHKRKFLFTCDNKTEFLLDLEKAHHLKQGEGCLLADGSVILIIAANEECLELTSENPARLLKLAWHIGNRHTPAEITETAIYIAYDHVLEQMVRGLGVSLTKVTRQFQPEQGAYHAH